MTKDTYKIEGYEVKENNVKPHGNGARVILPKDWVGEKAKIIRVTDKTNSPKIQPTAVIMYEELRSQDDGFNLRKIMKKVVRYRNFTEINNNIANDFNSSIENVKATKELEKIIDNNERSSDILNFYKNIVNNRDNRTNLMTILEKWI